MVLQKEIIYALLGHTGRVVTDDGNAFHLAKSLPLVDESERHLLNRLLVLGHCYHELEGFLSLFLFEDSSAGVRGEGTVSHESGPYVLAFALGLEECLQPYRAHVLALEQSLLRQPDLSLPAMQLGFGDFELTLPALRRLVTTVQDSNIRGVALLDYLHASAASCVHSMRAALRVLLRHTQRVLRSQMAAWLLHGELLPGDGDFFIQHVGAEAGDSDGSVIADVAAAVTATAGSAASAASDAGADATNLGDEGGGWFAYDIAVENKPAALPMRVAERVLFVGKAVRVLRASELRRRHAKQYEPLAATAAHLQSAAVAGVAGGVTGVAWDGLLEDTPVGTPRRGGALATPMHAGQRPALASPLSGSATPRGVTPRGATPRGARAHPLIGGGLEGAREALVTASASLEAAELAQEQAAIREVEVEAAGRSLLASILAAGDGTAAVATGAAAEEAAALAPLAEGAASGAAAEMHEALHQYGKELRGLPMTDGSLELPPLERLLARMHRTSSALLWRHLTLECGLLDLLTAVKEFYLLGRGNIFHTLLEELRPLMANAPSPLLDLQAVLGIATSGEPADAHLQSLRLSFADAADGADGDASRGAGGVAGATSPYELWRRLSIELHVGWPLELLVHAKARARYGQLFRFLLLVKRVQMELHAAWATQTQSGTLPTEQRALLLPLWRLRAHMAFLIDNLQYYLQVDVLEGQWQGFMRTAATCQDFEELAAAHEACLSALHAQCFLQASSVSSALHQIFQLCLSLCRMLSYAEAGARAEATYRSQFATVSREFSRQSAFLFAFLSNMSSPQQSPHLSQLLLRLNFNSFFQTRASGAAAAGGPGPSTNASGEY